MRGTVWKSRHWPALVLVLVCLAPAPLCPDALVVTKAMTVHLGGGGLTLLTSQFGSVVIRALIRM